MYKGNQEIKKYLQSDKKEGHGKRFMYLYKQAETNTGVYRCGHATGTIIAAFLHVSLLQTISIKIERASGRCTSDDTLIINTVNLGWQTFSELAIDVV